MGGLVMKLQYLIPFILLLSIVLGACNGQYNNELNYQTDEKQVTNGEENDKYDKNNEKNEENENNKKQDTTKENETAETLEETKAKNLMSQYRTLFEEIIAKSGEDQFLEEYTTLEEIREYFNQIMVTELAEWYTDAYFELRNGNVYIIPKDGPVWLKEEQSFELNKVDDHSYQLKQQRNNELLGHVYYTVLFTYIEGTWKIAEIDFEEVDQVSEEEAKFLVRDHLDFLWTDNSIVEVTEEKNEQYQLQVYEKLQENEDRTITRGVFFVNKENSVISRQIEKNAEVSGYASDAVKNLGLIIIHALEQKDMKEVVAHVDEDKGLLFSPYLYIQSESVVFTSEQVKQFFQDTNEYVWGHFDGRGNPIKKTPQEYYKRFIYVENFIEADEVVYNEIVKRGNLKSNINEVFDEVEFVEYFVSGSDEFDGMDWRSLILVFDTSDRVKPELVAIIHNQWTI
jgi:hypothetical protein